MPDLSSGKLNRLSQTNYGVDANLGGRLASGINKDLNGVSKDLFGVDANGAAAQLYALFGGDARATNTTGVLRTPDAPALTVSGNLDVRVIAKFAPVTAIRVMAGQWSGAANLGWMFATDATGKPFLQWSPDGTASSTIFATSSVSNYREAYRATLTLATGNVVLYRGPTITGPWTSMGSGGSTPTTIFDSTQQLSFGGQSGGAFPVVGDLYRLQLRNGIDGTILTDIDLTTKTPGQSTYTDDVSGLTWTRTADFTVVAT